MYFLNRFNKKDFSILIGNTLDHFDTTLYSSLAPVIAPLFFPTHGQLTQLILVYGTLISSIITRPLGSIFFSIIANNVNPMKSLSYSLIGVAISTIIIGLLPNYSSVGLLAPISLFFARAFQGLFSAGEVTIAKQYIIDSNLLNNKVNKVSNAYQASSVIGIILATFVSWISINTSYNQAWRYCFLLGGVTAYWGFILRKNDVEILKKNFEASFISLKDTITIFKNYKVIIIYLGLINSFSNITYIIPFVVMNSIPSFELVKYQNILGVNFILIIIDLLLIITLGNVLPKYNQVKVMVNSCLLIAFSIIPLWYNIDKRSLSYYIFVKTWIILIGVVYLCPLNIFINRTFSNLKYKYVIIGLGDSLGSIVERLTPTICFSLYYVTKSPLSIALYVLFFSIITIISLFFIEKESKKI